jgi:hypothetical protein
MVKPPHTWHQPHTGDTRSKRHHPSPYHRYTTLSPSTTTIRTQHQHRPHSWLLFYKEMRFFFRTTSTVRKTIAKAKTSQQLRQLQPHQQNTVNIKMTAAAAATPPPLVKTKTKTKIHLFVFRTRTHRNKDSAFVSRTQTTNHRTKAPEQKNDAEHDFGNRAKETTQNNSPQLSKMLVNY